MAIANDYLHGVMLEGLSLHMTFSAPRSLPTKRVSQVLLSSTASIISLPTAQFTSHMGEAAHGHRGAGVRKMWGVPGF